MARIKLGPVITDIAGSVGGATIQRNRFGMTMRVKPLPIKSATSAQLDIRRKIISLQYSWQALTDAERLQWNRFINFSGQTIRRDRAVLMSGQALYLKYQLFRLLYDQSLLTTIAYSPMPEVTFLDFIGLHAAELFLSFDDTIDHASYFFLCKLTCPRTKAQAYNPRGLRFMKTLFITELQFNITSQYVAAFGALPPVNSWVHYSVQFFSTPAPVFSGVYTGKVRIIPF